MSTMQQLHEYKTNERFLKNKKFSRLPKLAVYRKSEWIFKVKRKNCISVGRHKTWAKFYKFWRPAWHLRCSLLRKL